MVANLTPEELWVIATASVCAIACAIPGVFLMLSRSSLLADGIAHSSLAGIGAVFLLAHTRNPLAMLLGALAAGLVTAWLTSALHRNSILKPDASLGIVFTALFSIGVLSVHVVGRYVDLDPGCVLYGLIELAPFDTITILSYEVPRTLILLSILACINAVLCALFWKELAISTFDPLLASTLGFAPRRMHQGVLLMVTITIVLSFEAVGSILVVSMLVAPAASAYLISKRLATVALLAPCIGVLASVLGYLGAASLNTSVAGMMSTSAGALFLAAAIFSPHQGVLLSLLTRWKMHYRIVRDDILGLLYRWHEVASQGNSKPLSPIFIAGAVTSPALARLALWSLRRSGEVVGSRDGSLRLSERGLVEARALVRSHRLWESYLAKHLNLPHDHLHAPSERVEHFIGRALARDIAEDLETPKDPHGKTIP
jgi:manganese/zinc/iron transport system permease protein